MMRFFSRSILAFAVIASISMALVQTVTAAVPFVGSGRGEVIAVQPVGSQVLMTGVGTGEATHLGRFNRIENILLNPGDGTFTGDLTFTAANGDQLTCTIAGGFTSGTTAGGTYTLTGGSGRFSNAAGTAYFTVALSDPAHFTFQFSGSLAN